MMVRWQVLDDCHGDTSAAIEYIIAEKNFSEEIYQSARDMEETLSKAEFEGTWLLSSLSKDACNI